MSAWREKGGTRGDGKKLDGEPTRTEGGGRGGRALAAAVEGGQ